MSAPFRFLSGADIARLPRPKWLIDDIICAKRFGLMYSSHTVEKAHPAIDMSLSIAHGVDWYCKAVTRGTVMYVLADRNLRYPTSVTTAAFEQWHEERNISSDNATIQTWVRDLKLTDEQSIDHFIDCCKPLGPISLIVVDDMDGCLRHDPNIGVHDIDRFWRRTSEELGSALMVLCSEVLLRDRYWLLKCWVDSLFKIRRYGHGKRFIVEKQSTTGRPPPPIKLRRSAVEKKYGGG